MDKFRRSNLMSKIKSKDTKPELFVRKSLYKNGFRYRLHCKHLPGKPDLVLSKYKAVIYVHGCFWHHHNANCKIAHFPKTRQEYWIPKIQKNVDRFNHQEKLLSELGLKVIVIWECEIKSKPKETIDNLIKEILRG